MLRPYEDWIMKTVRKNIMITERQDRWIKEQVEAGNFGNEDEVFHNLISERISREPEIATIRAALVEGERSGISDKTVDEIRREAELMSKNNKKPRRG